MTETLLTALVVVETAVSAVAVATQAVAAVLATDASGEPVCTEQE